MAFHVQNNCNQGYSFKCECGNCPVLRYYPFHTIKMIVSEGFEGRPITRNPDSPNSYFNAFHQTGKIPIRQFCMEERNYLIYIYSKCWPQNICWVKPSSNVKIIDFSLEMSNQAMNTGGIVTFNKSKVSIPESNFQQVNESYNTKPGTTFPNPPEFDLSLSSTLQVVL